MVCQKCLSKSLSFLDNRPTDLKHFPVFSSNPTTDLMYRSFQSSSVSLPLKIELPTSLLHLCV